MNKKVQKKQTLMSKRLLQVACVSSFYLFFLEDEIVALIFEKRNNLIKFKRKIIFLLLEIAATKFFLFR